MSEKVRLTIDVDVDAVDLSDESVTRIVDVAAAVDDLPDASNLSLAEISQVMKAGVLAYELIPEVMISQVKPAEFGEVITDIVDQGGYYKKNIDVKADYEGFDCWVSDDGTCGFAISPEGELTNVFSTQTGRGQAMMRLATGLYERLTLNCFDGYTRKFYEHCGFVEDHREENYDGEGRDVVYMSYGYEA